MKKKFILSIIAVGIIIYSATYIYNGMNTVGEAKRAWYKKEERMNALKTTLSIAFGQIVLPDRECCKIEKLADFSILPESALHTTKCGNTILDSCLLFSTQNLESSHLQFVEHVLKNTCSYLPQPNFVDTLNEEDFAKLQKTYTAKGTLDKKATVADFLKFRNALQCGKNTTKDKVIIRSQAVGNTEDIVFNITY